MRAAANALSLRPLSIRYPATPGEIPSGGS